MSKFFAQYDDNGIVFSVVQSSVKPDALNVRECAGFDDLGKKWDGGKFVAVQKELRFKVFDKPRFIYALGLDVFNAINAGADQSLTFYKYILDNSPHVDMNIPEFRAMVESLHVAGLIDAQKLAFFLVRE